MEQIKTDKNGINIAPGQIEGSYYEDLLNLADKQLLIIKPALKDFIQKIILEQPDMLVFLDKGARIFGTPIKKYLSELNLPKMPEIIFYNDDDLKGAYLEERNKANQLDFEKIVMEDFANIKGKKIFFFDETFSSGKGAASLKAAKDMLGNEDIFYFAMTEDPYGKVYNWSDEVKVKEYTRMFYGIPLERHNEMLAEIEKDEKFKIYDNRIRDLFSRTAAGLYLSEIEQNGRMTTVHRNSRKQSRMISELAESQGRGLISVPPASKYANANSDPKPEEIKKLNYKTVGEIKKKIYETLRR